MKLPEEFKKPGFKQFIKKVILFILIFIVYSAILGPVIVNHGLLDTYSYYIYGGIGQIFLFFTLAFIIGSRKKLFALKKYKKANWILIIPSLILAVGWFLLGKYINNTLADQRILTVLIASHILFLSIFAVLALAVFGIPFIKDFIKNFKKEIIYILILTIIAYIAMTYVWKAWTFFSDIVTTAVYNMLKLTFSNATMRIPRYLSLNGFGVNIAEACSGLYSMFLFICVNIIVLALEWNKKINKTKAVLMMIPGLIGVFLVNILRIYLLMLVGAFISPAFGIGLFHSYIGSLLLLIYALIYLYIFYKITPLKNNKSNKKKTKR